MTKTDLIKTVRKSDQFTNTQKDQIVEIINTGFLYRKKNIHIANDYLQINAKVTQIRRLRVLTQ